MQRSLNHLSVLIQKHFILSLLIIIVLCIIINWIIFAMDNNENPHFYRNHIVINENSKDKKKYLSSSFTDSTYFTLSTISTVGYGDITPISSQAKAWASFMHFLVIVMTYKLFEYVYNKDEKTTQAFANIIKEKNSEISILKDENKELQSQITIHI